MKAREKLIRRLAFKRRIKNRFRAWGKRFLLAEICGALLAVVASYTTIYFVHNAVVAAYAGAIGDTIGFYTPIIIQDARAMRKELRLKNKLFGFAAVLHLVKNMLLEFGPAEIIDSAILRPLFMYYFPILLHNYPIGILVGKLAGDVAFYIPVTVSNRLRAILKRSRA
jgi:hypothetical protein